VNLRRTTLENTPYTEAESRASARDHRAAGRSFSVRFSTNQPLKLGIHRDLLAARPGGFSGIRLRRALQHHTSGAAYLRNCVAGAARVDLDGELAGKVTADEAKYAAERLAQIEGRVKSRSATVAGRASQLSVNDDHPPSFTDSPPIATENTVKAPRSPERRVTFADLRASAAARKAAP
jgi:sRNA-binding protein